MFGYSQLTHFISHEFLVISIHWCTFQRLRLDIDTFLSRDRKVILRSHYKEWTSNHVVFHLQGIFKANPVANTSIISPICFFVVTCIREHWLSDGASSGQCIYYWFGLIFSQHFLVNFNISLTLSKILFVDSYFCDYS